ncbi:MAG: phosphoribosylglycinamide formyltransferase [Planctomycetia bacterium]|nr:phosphoribosylglycinamide formyltransferase [Planctomycetia bacterium]
MDRTLQKSPLRFAVLISGGGTTLKSFIDQISAGQLDARIELVVSSSPKAGGLKFAEAAGIPRLVVDPRDCATPAEFGEAVFGPCRAAGVDLVAMAGYLKLVPIPPDFANRVMNIHPGLIPNYCGPGMYGLKVHRAVLQAGEKTSGCTVHFVDNQYDHGPIILQRTVPVEPGDTPESLAARVFAAECEAYPAALRLFAAGRLSVVGEHVHIS